MSQVSPKPTDRAPLERIVKGRAAFDFRADPDPEKRKYGQHPAELYFAVKGPLGAISVCVFTGWTIEMLDLGKWRVAGRPTMWPFAAELVMHHAAAAPTPETDHCDLLDGLCRPSRSFSGADPFWRALVSEGLDALWAALEQRYREEFGEAH